MHVVPLEESKFETHSAAIKRRAAWLGAIGRVHPTVPVQNRRDALEIVEPDGHVKVAVLPCDGAGMEVHRPAAEQPVLDRFGLEALMEPVEGVELVCG